MKPALYSGSHDGPKYHDAGIVAMEHLIGPNFLIEKNDIKCKEDIRTIVLDVMSKSVYVYREWMAALTTLGIKVLRNGSDVLTKGRIASLVVGGTTDLGASRFGERAAER